jgi:hypothetical protein
MRSLWCAPAPRVSRWRISAVALAVAGAAGAVVAPRAAHAQPAPQNGEPAAVEAERVAARLLAEEMISSGAYRKLAWLTDRIGARLSGTPQAERAVAWAIEEFRRDGLGRVRAEKVMVPRWERGAASAAIVSPVPQPLAALALGMSVPTPPGGIAAEVVEADSFESLRALGERVRGRIVLFNRPTRPDPHGAGYGENGHLRYRGPSEAARQGAVAVLVRSLGTLNARLPHTGALGYLDDAPRIPAAAVAAEDAELIHRLLQAGETVRVELRLGCRTHPDVESANVVAELRGRERPDEIVLIGAHLDSWDVGTGAIDNGSGVAVTMEALRLLKSLGLTPRRTIRAVLFMNEENGVRGGKTYAADHREELPLHVAAIESDSGAGRPLGFFVNAGEGGVEAVRAEARALSGLGAGEVRSGGEGGTDIAPLKSGGVPTIGLRQDMTRYFDWHHTEADTLDKVDPVELAHNAVAMAYMAWALAEREAPLPRVPPAPESPSAPGSLDGSADAPDGEAEAPVLTRLPGGAAPRGRGAPGRISPRPPA